MKRFILSFVVMFAFVSLSYAVDYTISTTVLQEKALSVIVAKENAVRASKTPPLSVLTNQQYLDLVLRDVFNSYAKQVTERDIDNLDLANKWRMLTDEQRNQIKNVLGVK